MSFPGLPLSGAAVAPGQAEPQRSVGEESLDELATASSGESTLPQSDIREVSEQLRFVRRGNPYALSRELALLGVPYTELAIAVAQHRNSLTAIL